MPVLASNILSLVFLTLHYLHGHQSLSLCCNLFNYVMDLNVLICFIISFFVI